MINVFMHYCYSPKQIIPNNKFQILLNYQKAKLIQFHKKLRKKNKFILTKESEKKLKLLKLSM